MGVLGVAAASVAAWWSWLGRDREYQVDPATGVSSGPYEVWQVAGCVLSLAVIAIVGALLLSAWIVVASMTVAFTVAWSMAAASTDESGLWGVGATMVFIGLAAGSALLSFTTSLIRRRLLVGAPASRR
jgi:hypothetical protein